jgi:hypothetical protein
MVATWDGLKKTSIGNRSAQPHSWVPRPVGGILNHLLTHVSRSFVLLSGANVCKIERDPMYFADQYRKKARKLTWLIFEKGFPVTDTAKEFLAIIK